MDTRIVKINAQNGTMFSENDISVIKDAGKIITNGGLVAFPTETVYGLGGDAFNPEASARIYEAKGRPSDNPLIVHIADIDDIDKIAKDIPKSFYALYDNFMPGPLTVILKKQDKLPKETTGGLSTVAVRMPSNPIARALIRESGGFIAAPSANKSGRPSPTLAKYVIEDLNGRVDMIIDGGDSLIGLESTIVDLTDEIPVILRPGAITLDDIKAVLGAASLDKAIIDDKSNIPPKAPGMKYRHYAPKGELTIVRGERSAVMEYVNKCALSEDKITSVIATSETVSGYKTNIVKTIGSRDNEDELAHNLYRLLRELDDEGAEIIYAEAFDDKGISQALMNRLLKAAGYKEVRL